MSIEAIDRTLNQTDLEPGRLLNKEGAVVLSVAEWHTIQAYVEHGLGLPTTEAALRHELNIKPEETYDPFKKLRGAMIKAYTGVHENCFTWKTKTYPNIVDLADDIVDYARTSEASYKLLREKSKQIGDTDIDAKNELHADFLKVLERLIQDAELRRDRAASVLAEINDFQSRMEQNKENLEHVPVEASEEYKELKDHTKEIHDAIDELLEQLKTCWNVVKKDIAVLATSAIYAPVVIWFLPPIPVGLIAAGIVDTIHAIELDKMKRKIDALQELLDAQNERLQRDSVLLTRFEGAQSHVSSFLKELESVKPLVAAVFGIWRSIAKDLRKNADTLEATMTEQNDFTREVDLLFVANAWQSVKDKADFWRQVAFIEVQEEPLNQAAE